MRPVPESSAEWHCSNPLGSSNVIGNSGGLVDRSRCLHPNAICLR
jgi:hypothetical protein